jgi:hypothetical protein
MLDAGERAVRVLERIEGDPPVRRQVGERFTGGRDRGIGNKRRVDLVRQRVDPPPNGLLARSGRACRRGCIHQPPRAGMVRAAILAEIGCARGLFPTEDTLAATTGVLPSTRASGRARAVAPPRLQSPPASGPGRLRRRQPQRQPLGPDHLRTSPRPRCPPRPRQPDPGPRLDRCDSCAGSPPANGVTAGRKPPEGPAVTPSDVVLVLYDLDVMVLFAPFSEACRYG